MFIIWKDIVRYSINQEEIDFNKQDSYKNTELIPLIGRELYLKKATYEIPRVKILKICLKIFI